MTTQYSEALIRGKGLTLSARSDILFEDELSY